MGLNWTEKYRPRRLEEIVGNPQAIGALREWGRQWMTGPPAKRAVLLHGPPGSGKTSAAHALALEFGWGLLELNASDVRSATAIRRVAGEGARHETFSDAGEYFSSAEGKRKLIVLDEADNLYERGGDEARAGDEDFSDRGGKRAILETVAQAQQPIVLIANDAYTLTKSASFERQVLSIPFRGLTAPTVAKLLRKVAGDEGLTVDDPTLHELSMRANGDARSALNDLQAIAQGITTVASGAAKGLGDRNRPETMFGAMAAILKGEDGAEARRTVQALDEEPGFVLAWLDENVPREYHEPGDLEEAYEWISRADVFLGRVMRRQSFGLWATATDLMTVGVSSAKARPYRSPPQYRFPNWIRRMAGSKGERSLQRDLAGKISPLLHTGFRVSRTELLPFFRSLSLRDTDFAESIAIRFDLDEEEIRHVLGPEAKEAYLEHLLSRIRARREQAPAQRAVEEPGPRPEAKPSPPESKAAGRSRNLMDF